MTQLYNSTTHHRVASAGSVAIILSFIFSFTLPNSDRSIQTAAKLEKIDLYEAYAFTSGTVLETNDDYIFVTEGSDHHKVLAIDKDAHENYHYIGRGEGEGPGEVQILNNMDVQNDRIILFDRINLKILTYDVDDELLDEIMLDESAVNADQMAVGSDYYFLIKTNPAENVFLQLDQVGEVVAEFEQIETDEPGFIDDAPVNLKYSGHLASNEHDELFYAGHSEPVINKYAPGGELLYTTETIENLDSSDNYDVSGNMIQYSEDAVFSSAAMTLWDEYIVITPSDNEDDDLGSAQPLLDLYHQSDGEYSSSIELKTSPTYVVVEADYIYSLEFRDGLPYLIVYENPVG